MYVSSISENQGFLAHFYNIPMDVTITPIKDLPEPSDLPRNITPLFDDSDSSLTYGS